VTSIVQDLEKTGTTEYAEHKEGETFGLADPISVSSVFSVVDWSSESRNAPNTPILYSIPLFVAFVPFVV
jgi:hypothetical protein